VPFDFDPRRRPEGFGAASGEEAVDSEAGASAAGGAGSEISGAGLSGGGGAAATGVGIAIGTGGGGAGATGGEGGTDGPTDGVAGAGLEGIGTNSPGRQVWGILRTDGSFRKRSACPQFRQSRVPSDSSPRERIERLPPPIVPVRSSFTQTNSDVPQLLHIGAKEDTRRPNEARLPYKAVRAGPRAAGATPMYDRSDSLAPWT
jgi:hypothetical protein